ncbi:DegT/DnrJ/EryC1/StrS aminotransferase family protein [Microcoleus sp. AT9_B5]
MIARWEVGSEFHWSDDALTPPSSSENLFPENYELFSTATGILLAIERFLKGSREGRLRLHLPTYYCMEVAAKISKNFELCWYRDLPAEPVPDFNSLRPLPGDLVLAVNLFGVKEGKPWQDWLSQNQDIILIEDHSHDPFSLWAQHTTAHFAMASLRKTLPIPDGAMIWSGQKMELPRPSKPESPAAAQKLTAMLLKRSYLMGADISKDSYRSLQMEGEEHLINDGDRSISTLTNNVLLSLKISEMRQQRATNVKDFLDMLLKNQQESYQPLFTNWSSGSVPFNSILLCKNHQIREELRRFLISKNIFAPVHWPQPPDRLSGNDPKAFDLSNRLLTVPTDHRYSYNDIEQVAAKFAEFSQLQPSASY